MARDETTGGPNTKWLGIPIPQGKLRGPKEKGVDGDCNGSRKFKSEVGKINQARENQ